MLNALAPLSSFMSLEKRRLTMNAFFNSQFGYCPLIWMFHSRTLNKRINRIYERALRIVYMVLATKDYKVKMGLAPHTHEYNL